MKRKRQRLKPGAASFPSMRGLVRDRGNPYLVLYMSARYDPSAASRYHFTIRSPTVCPAPAKLTRTQRETLCPLP